MRFEQFTGQTLEEATPQWKHKSKKPAGKKPPAKGNTSPHPGRGKMVGSSATEPMRGRDIEEVKEPEGGSARARNNSSLMSRKGGAMKDRKKAAKRGERKHKGAPINEGFLDALEGFIKMFKPEYDAASRREIAELQQAMKNDPELAEIIKNGANVNGHWKPGYRKKFVDYISKTMSPEYAKKMGYFRLGDKKKNPNYDKPRGGLGGFIDIITGNERSPDLDYYDYDWKGKAKREPSQGAPDLAARGMAAKLSNQGFRKRVTGEGKKHGNSKIYDKCWDGYEKVPGKRRGEEGSCRKKSANEGLADLDVQITGYGKVDPNFAKSKDHPIVLKSKVSGKHRRYKSLKDMRKSPQYNIYSDSEFKEFWARVKAGKDSRFKLVRNDLDESPLVTRKGQHLHQMVSTIFKDYMDQNPDPAQLKELLRIMGRNMDITGNRVVIDMLKNMGVDESVSGKDMVADIEDKLSFVRYLRQQFAKSGDDPETMAEIMRKEKELRSRLKGLRGN